MSNPNTPPTDASSTPGTTGSDATTEGESAFSPEEIYRLQREWTLKTLGDFAIGAQALTNEQIYSRKPEPPKVEAPDLPSASHWGNVALKGKPMSMPDLWPKNRREENKAMKSYEDQKHLGTLRATKSLYESGVYRIGQDGKSKLRDHIGELKHFPRAERKSIIRTERTYKKVSDHEHHIYEDLTLSGESRLQKIRRKLKAKLSHHS